MVASGSSPSRISRQWTSAGAGSGLGLALRRRLAAVAVGGDDLVVAGAQRLARRRRRSGRHRHSASAVTVGRANQAVEVVDERAPLDVGTVALPSGELGGVRQLEHDGAVAGLDDRGDELVAAVGEGCLGTDPARGNRPRRPQDDHRLGVAEALLDHFVERLARVERGIPPDREALLDQALREGARRRPVGRVHRTGRYQFRTLAPHGLPLTSRSQRKRAARPKSGTRTHHG